MLWISERMSQPGLTSWIIVLQTQESPHKNAEAVLCGRIPDDSLRHKLRRPEFLHSRTPNQSFHPADKASNQHLLRRVIMNNYARNPDRQHEQSPPKTIYQKYISGRLRNLEHRHSSKEISPRKSPQHSHGLLILLVALQLHNETAIIVYSHDGSLLLIAAQVIPHQISPCSSHDGLSRTLRSPRREIHSADGFQQTERRKPNRERCVRAGHTAGYTATAQRAPLLKSRDPLENQLTSDYHGEHEGNKTQGASVSLNKQLHNGYPSDDKNHVAVSHADILDETSPVRQSDVARKANAIWTRIFAELEFNKPPGGAHAASLVDFGVTIVKPPLVGHGNTTVSNCPPIATLPLAFSDNAPGSVVVLDL
mmetsp:Transcript_34465/g.89818  ORF Transcript_34465/g.89818 Transcript_34465/m.89818 type:complete len:366 (-) Transcript_34465:1565-2662(-)